MVDEGAGAISLALLYFVEGTVTLIVHFIVWDCIFPEKTVFYKTDEETHEYISEHRRKRGAHYENCNSGSRQPGTGYGIYPI